MAATRERSPEKYDHFEWPDFDKFFTRLLMGATESGYERDVLRDVKNAMWEFWKKRAEHWGKKKLPRVLDQLYEASQAETYANITRKPGEPYRNKALMELCAAAEDIIQRERQEAIESIKPKVPVADDPATESIMRRDSGDWEGRGHLKNNTGTTVCCHGIPTDMPCSWCKEKP